MRQFEVRGFRGASHTVRASPEIMAAVLAALGPEVVRPRQLAEATGFGELAVWAAALQLQDEGQAQIHTVGPVAYIGR